MSDRKSRAVVGCSGMPKIIQSSIMVEHHFPIEIGCFGDYWSMQPTCFVKTIGDCCGDEFPRSFSSRVSPVAPRSGRSPRVENDFRCDTRDVSTNLNYL